MKKLIIFLIILLAISCSKEPGIVGEWNINFVKQTFSSSGEELLRKETKSVVDFLETGVVVAELLEGSIWQLYPDNSLFWGYYDKFPEPNTFQGNVYRNVMDRRHEKMWESRDTLYFNPPGGGLDYRIKYQSISLKD